MSEILGFLEDLRSIFKLYKEYKKTKEKDPKNRRQIKCKNLSSVNKQGPQYRSCFHIVFKELKMMDPEEFFKYTRMTKQIYNTFLNLIMKDIKESTHQFNLEPETRIAITLSYLSQGTSIQMLSLKYKIEERIITQIILENCDIIWNKLSVLYLTEPTQKDYIKIAEQFNIRWNMPNCLGAIDCKNITIQCSQKNDIINKKSSTISLLATCDGRYTFTNFCISNNKSEQILRNTKFGKNLLDKNLPLPNDKKLEKSNLIFPHYFVANTPFPLKENIMKPFPGKNLEQSKKIFNYRLSRARRVIINAFGVLISRWKILKNKINLSPKNAEKVILATVVLHNFIKLNDLHQVYCPPNYLDWEDIEYKIHAGEWRNDITNLFSVHFDSIKSTKKAFELRKKLMNYFLNEGSVTFQER